jgi:hypothetical protein
MKYVRLFVLAALLAATTAGVVFWRRYDVPARSAWGEVAGQASLMEDAIRTRRLSLVDARERRLHAAIKRLRAVRYVALYDAPRLRVALEELSTEAVATHSAADADDQAGAERAWERAKAALSRARQAIPGRMANFVTADPSTVYSCPMHPEVRSEKPGRCPQCGMPLEPQDGHVGPFVTARVIPETPVRVGEVAQRTLELTGPDGKPITFAELEEVHTKKIHLLIVDESLTDYKHEHPTPSAIAGQYSFSFVPARPGPYHVWADVMPAATQVQEFARLTIEGSGRGEPLSSRDVRLTDTVGPLHFELSAGGPLVERTSTPLRLVITEGGAVFNQLEPIMGTYAHLVGFSQDLQQISHIHPLGTGPANEDDRGVGSLEFSFRPKSAGTIVMFAQVQVGGSSRFARFVLQVGDEGLARKAAGVGAGL